ncbi:MAG: tyrosine-type recombinase/integrase, partial [Bacteroidia bacterium]
NNKRHRFWNGKAIGIQLRAIENPELLKAAFELKLIEGWRPKWEKKRVSTAPITVLQALCQGMKIKRSQDCSNRFIKDCKRVVILWQRFEHENQIKGLTLDRLEPIHIKNFLNRPNWSAKTQRTIKSTISPLLRESMPDIMKGIKLKRPISKLHKSYKNIPEILEEIKSFDHNLYLCCLFTYGCLLRPHREIRELKWGDFSSDLKHIHLSGSRNKSGRNRIVPVPEFIRILLEPGQKDQNIFSGTTQPYNADYFKTVWGRFKKTSKLLEDGQTLYSFRHSGAIDIFQRTGSIVKLKQAMGHSSIYVSLTYLRGLEVAELTEEDMPMV